MLRGVYAWSDVPDTLETRARAVGLVRPRLTVVGRTTAAWLAGVDVLPPGWSPADDAVHLIVTPDVTPPRLSGCRATQAALPESDLTESYGIVRTSDLRTALDLARFAPRPQAVASADAFTNQGRVTLRELWERARSLQRVRNCRVLRANLAAADPGAQSYAESAQRVLFLDAGLPRPSTQIAVVTATGELLAYLDLGWAKYLLASEYDGEEHHDTLAARAADDGRRRRISLETGWHVDVVRRAQLWGQPAALVEHTAGLLLARGWAPASPLVLEQITRAAAYERATGLRWQWMPLDRLFAA